MAIPKRLIAKKSKGNFSHKNNPGFLVGIFYAAAIPAFRCIFFSATRQKRMPLQSGLTCRKYLTSNVQIY